MREFERIRAAIIRGGTSKGVFVLQNELPFDPVVRDQVILSIYGNDDRQIDGLGGADSLTSKVAMVRVSQNPEADVEYTFGQVGIGTKSIDYKTNCGNILSGVGPYAIDEGLVAAKEPITKVRIYNTNTNKIIIAHVPVENGRSKSIGSFSIDGVPGTGAKILLEFLQAAGAKTGALFPTGKRQERLRCKSGEYPVSIVDVTTPVVFVRADAVGLTGTEYPEDLSLTQLQQLEDIRGEGARQLGFVSSAEDARIYTPASPKLIVVSPPTTYTTTSGREVQASEVSFVSRAMSMQKMHRAFPVTGGLCTAVAARISGTVVYECNTTKQGKTITIAHPSGRMDFVAKVRETQGSEPVIEQAAVARTARRLMEGYAYTPSSLFWSNHTG